MGEAQNDPGGDRIAHRRYNDGDRSRAPFCRKNGGCAGRHDDDDLELDRLSYQRREAVVVAFGPAVVDHNIPALDVVEIAQAVAQGRDKLGLQRCRGIAQVGVAIHASRLLRPSGARRSKGTGQRGQQEAATVHAGMVGLRPGQSNLA